MSHHLGLPATVKHENKRKKKGENKIRVDHNKHTNTQELREEEGEEEENENRQRVTGSTEERFGVFAAPPHAALSVARLMHSTPCLKIAPAEKNPPLPPTRPTV